MSGYEDLNFAKLDTERSKRTGFPETVFCQGKKDEFLIDIFKKLYEANGEVMGTRATEHQAALIKGILPNAKFDDVSKIITVQNRRCQTMRRCIRIDFVLQ